jgi:hypothetical protein
MCGCETCIGVCYLQAALNRFRVNNVAKRQKEIAILKQTAQQETRTRSRDSEQEKVREAEDKLQTYKDFVLPNGEPLHPKPKDALGAIM